MSAPRRRRWMEVLRRTATGDLGLRPARGRAGAVDDAALWGTHEQAKRSVVQSSALAERVATAVARHRGQIDSSAERSGLMVTRAEGLGVSAARVGDAFERLGVIALNAGLEGARMGEPQGRALLLLSEEIRVNVTRGGEASRKLAEVVDELVVEAGDVQRQLERCRADAGEVSQQAAQLHAATQEADKALEELGHRLRRATGIDPEVARALGVAAEHARGLVTALSALSAAGKDAPVLSALRPVMEPLSRLLAELGDLEGDEAGRGPDDGGVP